MSAFAPVYVMVLLQKSVYATSDGWLRLREQWRHDFSICVAQDTYCSKIGLVHLWVPQEHLGAWSEDPAVSSWTRNEAMNSLSLP